MQEHEHDTLVSDSDQFPTDPAGLPEARASEIVELADGDEFDLRIAPVAKRLGEATGRMLAYNGSIPGPTLKVAEGSHVVVNVVNETDLEATVHWHGLRLDNRYDGTHETQAPISVGGNFSYHLEFPDPGLYWYHPHIREDYGQEMGLYANILVVPADPDYWPPVHRELLLTLDDVLVEDGKIAPFSRTETTYAAMGRFGNVLLVGGETDLSLTVQRGEVVRFYLTNTANTRVFKVALPGARMKLVGGDSGRHEHEQFVNSVILAPSERAIVDVLVDEPGQLTLEHQTPERTYSLATVTVSADEAAPLDQQYENLRSNPEWVTEREQLAPFLSAPPDKTLAFVAEMDMGTPEGRVVYACPMHPEVVSDEPGKCPQCGMKLLATAAPESYVCPMHPEVVSDEPGKCPHCGMKLLPASVVASASGQEMHDSRRTTSTNTTATRTTTTRTTTTRTWRPAGSSGRTTWSTSTASPRPRTRAGASSTRTPAPPTTRSTGSSGSGTGSSCGWSTRWTPTIRCTTRSTSTARAASSCSHAMASPTTISCGRTRC